MKIITTRTKIDGNIVEYIGKCPVGQAMYRADSGDIYFANGAGYATHVITKNEDGDHTVVAV